MQLIFSKVKIIALMWNNEILSKKIKGIITLLHAIWIIVCEIFCHNFYKVIIIAVWYLFEKMGKLYYMRKIKSISISCLLNNRLLNFCGTRHWWISQMIILIWNMVVTPWVILFIYFTCDLLFMSSFIIKRSNNQLITESSNTFH